MFGFEQFLTLNRWLTGMWRLAWLNILWAVVTILGLGVLGFGPASYALAKYMDRWLRHGQTPPVTRTFFRDVVQRRWQPVLIGVVLQGAGAVILVNLMSLTNWYLHVANLGALVVVGILAAYVFAVMAALDLHGLRAQFSGALLLGLGSLHWTIIGTTAVAICYALMFRFAVPLFALFGAALPAFVVALIVRRILRELQTAPTAPSTTEKTYPVRLSAGRAGRTEASSRRPMSVLDRAHLPTKGTAE